MNKIKRYFKHRFLTGHIAIGKVTVFGRNAMHWGVDISLKRGYLCFRLPLPCFGRWWPLYLYYSPDGTPNAAKWGYGKRHHNFETGLIGYLFKGKSK